MLAQLTALREFVAALQSANVERGAGWIVKAREEHPALVAFIDAALSDDPAVTWKKLCAWFPSLVYVKDGEQTVRAIVERVKR